MKRIAILGSTGSIGTQTLDIISQFPDRFEVYALTANNNVQLLAEQARKFQPEIVCIANEQHYAKLKGSLADLPVKVYAGADAIAQMVSMGPIDVVLASMVGYAGLKPTIEAIKAGKQIALANKETLVVAGELICKLSKEYHSQILPVDSEHSAIFQCLSGEGDNPVEKLLLTASGGPFRDKSVDELRHVNAAQALKHPNWDMGAKITIDSASMMNKGFEVIEAKWLFGIEPERIEVVVHPQSIVHSMVQFADGCIKAQLGMPDMRMPILYALTYPDRMVTNLPRWDYTQCGQLTFEKPDLQKFRNLAFAYQAIRQGGNMPCIINAANEVVVAGFLQGRIGFLQMSDIIETVIAKAAFIQNPAYEDYVQTDCEARKMASSLF